MRPWAIGVFEGESPLALAPRAGSTVPLLTAADITDVDAGFVADPFGILLDGWWHVFFEVFSVRRGQGVIAHAAGTDPSRLAYRGVVLREEFHLSYPLVFTDGGAVYMVPETLGCAEVRLYLADPFPSRWRPVATLVRRQLADPTVVAAGGCWWLFGCGRPRRHDQLSLFVAPALYGPWTEHPASPLVDGDPRRARPAGRPVRWQGRLLRFAQDCAGEYGRDVSAVGIETLTGSRYSEGARLLDPFADRGSGTWNGRGMHHVDAHEVAPGSWLAFVDGRAA